MTGFWQQSKCSASRTEPDYYCCHVPAGYPVTQQCPQSKYFPLSEEAAAPSGVLHIRTPQRGRCVGVCVGVCVCLYVCV